MATKRKLETAATTKEPTGEMNSLAVEFYTENQLSNEHGTKAKNARKSLFGMMLDMGIRSFTAEMRYPFGKGHKSVDLSVEIGEARATTVVDMERLRKIVADDEKLLSLCTMTKTDVVKHFGSIVADQCAKRVKGTENVQVKAAK